MARPLSFELQIVSTPDKLPVYFTWNVNCPFDGTDLSSQHTVNAVTPVSLQLTMPVADPDSDQAETSATLTSGTAEITVTITATTAPSPAPSPSPSGAKPQVTANTSRRPAAGPCLVLLSLSPEPAAAGPDAPLS